MRSAISSHPISRSLSTASESSPSKRPACSTLTYSVGCLLIVFGCSLIVFGCSLIVFGCSLIVFGCCWLVGCWLLLVRR